ncbi:CapA family protein [Thiohalorhabdus sp.]|uniref:CapA family protein n=1 Tax=Thiohalorhabdus sp. TaxID=3094134 RepID=UPI002FC2C753
MLTHPPSADTLRLFLCGDVMTGRGIDQVLPHSCDPTLHEPWITDARHYRQMAEEANGPIPAPVDYAYVWGDTLAWLQRFGPDRRIINLETAVTCNHQWWRGKGVHYRMHPENTELLKAAEIDACALANNHVLDWGNKGLTDTLDALHRAGVPTAGAGESLTAAQAPVLLPATGKGRVILLAMGSGSSGVPAEWAAGLDQSGIWRIDEGTDRAVAAVAEQVEGIKGPSDVVVASIHWGGNWGYAVPVEQRRFARSLIDDAGVDLIHGHSSHHPKGMEVYRDRLVLYGCGDFLNDYEGIPGEEDYRPELTLMYFPELARDSGRLTGLGMRPVRIRRFRATDANAEEARWLLDRLNREGETLGTRFTLDDDRTIRLTLS